MIKTTTKLTIKTLDTYKNSWTYPTHPYTWCKQSLQRHQNPCFCNTIERCTCDYIWFKRLRDLQSTLEQLNTTWQWQQYSQTLHSPPRKPLNPPSKHPPSVRWIVQRYAPPLPPPLHGVNPPTKLTILWNSESPLNTPSSHTHIG